MQVHDLTAPLTLAIACLNAPLLADSTNTTKLPYTAMAGPCAVEVVRLDWFDAKRDRKVPAKIYYPKASEGPYPVIIFSHGLGGSREGYEYLGRHWASYGYVSVHVQHLGSDNTVWEGVAAGEVLGKMQKAAVERANITNRPMDISFAIDELERLNREDAVFKKRLDLTRLGVGGHSFGAFTALAIAGERLVGPSGKAVTFADPRVKAVLAMSAPVPVLKFRVEQAFGSIKISCFHMTGTRDASPIGQTNAEERRLPFDHIKGPEQFLLTFKDGDHMIFSGRGRLRGGEKDGFFQSFILMSSTAYWDAYLRGDSQAKSWLAGGGFKSVLGDAGTFESK